MNTFDMIPPHDVSKEYMSKLEMLMMNKFRSLTRIGQEGLHSTVSKFAGMQDMQNSKGLGLPEFRALMHSIGLTIPDHQVAALFNHLASACGGGRVAIDHLESVMQVLNAGPCENYAYKSTHREEQAAVGKFTDSGGDANVEHVTEIITKILKTLTRKHQIGVRALFEAFREIDKERVHVVTHKQFHQALWTCRIILGSQEDEMLRFAFDYNRDGLCSYQEFLWTIHAQATKDADLRLSYIDAAWDALAGEGAESCPSAWLTEKFHPEASPYVANGERTPEQCTKNMVHFFGEVLRLPIVSKDLVRSFMLMESASMPGHGDFEQFAADCFAKPDA